MHTGLTRTLLTLFYFVLWTRRTAVALGMEGVIEAAATATVTTPKATAATCAKSAALMDMASASMGAAADPVSEAAVVRVGVERGTSRELLEFTIPGDTSNAANSAGNLSPICSGSSGCVNGCPSLFYRVTGGNGSQVTASTCLTASFPQLLYAWEGGQRHVLQFHVHRYDTFDRFPPRNSVGESVVPHSSLVLTESHSRAGFSGGGCSDPRSASLSWTAQAGAMYYVQVFGADDVGTYTLTVTSNDTIDVSKADVCGTTHPPEPTPSPTQPPTHSPTEAPTEAPTDVPTAAPTDVPTDAPTDVPTDAPTDAPTSVADPCAGVGTTYWLYDLATNAPVRRLSNHSASCLLHPYNIEVRPCQAASAGASNPVRVRLLDATGGPPLVVVHKSKIQRSAPYFLFGPAPTKDDVLSSPKPLRNGVYYLEAKGAPTWGRLRFAQKCPCPDGTKKKGKKGCMM